MVFQVQFFEIGNLIFSSDQHSRFMVNSDEIAEIQKRFQDIVNAFQSYTADYNSGLHASYGKIFPYNSATVVGKMNEHLILHFTDSYNEPVMMIYDTKKNTVRNYIDIGQAANILIDDTYEDIKGDLLCSKYLNNRFKGISDFDRFAEAYKELLKQHENKNTVTGRECFEVSVDEIDMV